MTVTPLFDPNDPNDPNTETNVLIKILSDPIYDLNGLSSDLNCPIIDLDDHVCELNSPIFIYSNMLSKKLKVSGLMFSPFSPLRL